MKVKPLPECFFDITITIAGLTKEWIWFTVIFYRRWVVDLPFGFTLKTFHYVTDSFHKSPFDYNHIICKEFLNACLCIED